MRTVATRVALVGLYFITAQALSAQPPSSSAPTTVPRLVRVTSVFVPANGLPAAPVETITMGIYAEEAGGAPLWQETQYVAVDADGRYTLLLGVTQPDGLPLELFASGDARWLGRRFERPGEHEQARVLLASVPYALKALDADTLGGRPPSAYLLADSSVSSAGAGDHADSKSAADTRTAPGSTVQALTAGTANYVAKFTNTTDLGDSAIYDAGGLVGVNTPTPFDALHVRFTNTAGTMTGYAVQNLSGAANAYSGMLFYDQNGALGNFQGFNNTTHEYRINNVASSGTINFMLGGTSRFQVRNDGDVSISGNVRKAGSRFLYSDVPGNLAVGVNAMGAVTTSTASVAVGNSALANMTGGGDANVGVGHRALEANNSFNNTAVGYQSFKSSTGFDNVGLGAYAGADQTSGNFNIYIGYLVGRSVNESNTIRIGTSGPYDRFFAGGIRGVTTGTPDAVPVVIDSSGQLGTVSSSRRFKEDIRDMGDASRALFALRPVTFRYARAYTDGSKPVQYGLVAEEVAEVFPDLAVYNAEGGVDTVHYETLSVLLLNELQKQQQRIEALERRLNALSTNPE